jgi:SagB-type dehydrogenase family enzyme
MITSASEYQRLTSYDRRRMGGHFLDWSNQPGVYKDYPDLPGIFLTHDSSPPNTGLFSLAGGEVPAEPPNAISLEQLSQVFALAYSLTAKSRHSGGDLYYRSVPSAGALYPCELYVATRAVTGLPDGLYHFAIGRHALSLLREGDFPEQGLFPSPPGSQQARSPSLTFFVTAIFFRSAWKYRERSYRYHLLDTGHLVENLALTLAALGLPCNVEYDYADEVVNGFLGLDTGREVCLAVLRVSGAGARSGDYQAPLAELPESVRDASRVADREVDYPAVLECHRATSRPGAESNLPQSVLPHVGPSPTSWQPITRPDPWPELMNFAEAVHRRRSLRNFVTVELAKSHFDALLNLLCEPQMLSGAGLPHRDAVAAGFFAANVEGLESGAYWLDPAKGAFGPTKTGPFMSRMAHICLDQEWLAQASLQFFFATNLQWLEQTRGPRGYRYAMMTAGRLGQRLYLGATTLGLGCCGIGAFYDREAAAELPGLNEASAMLYLVAVGPVKKVLGP